MWRITWRDLAFRRRRFLLAGIATALAFAVALLMSGVVVAVQNQNQRVVDRFAADGWWVPRGAGGPFTDGPVVSEAAAAQLAALPGVTRAEPVILLRTTLTDARSSSVTDVNLVGVRVDGLGRPKIDQGRWIQRSGEVVVDEGLGHHVGDTVETGGRRLEVVGVARQISYLFAVPTIFLGLRDAQTVGAGGQRAASAIVTQGLPTAAAPTGLVRYSDHGVLEDLNRVIGKGLSAVQTVQAIMLVAAAAIVALIIYLSAIERVRDVAVLTVTGASRGFVAFGLAIQSLLVTAPATLLAFGLARVLKPVFPLDLELTVGVHVELALLAVAVGLLASLVGVRRVLSVDPAEAFG
jgi:putative ABC transport system permease protein